MQSSTRILSDAELIAKAREILNPNVFDFISGGAGNEAGVANNTQAFQGYQIVPRVLQNAGAVQTNLDILGSTIDSPILLAPCAFQKLFCTDGELSAARAAEKAKTIMTLSTMSSQTLEDVAATTNQPKWFQLYLFKNREITQDLVKRAEASGYTALVVTVDVPVMGMRLRDVRNGFTIPNGIDAANLRNHGISSLSDKTDTSKIKEHTDQQFDSNIGWDTIDWLKSITKMPIIIKGILNPNDAVEAINHGASAIIVSNHGGRQIDSVISTIDALPSLTHIVNNRIPVIIDGGIRSGEDAFKAIALGATAVMIARPAMYALAIGGETGLTELLTRLTNELTMTMRLAGCKSLGIIRERGLSLLAGSTVHQLHFQEFMKQMSNRNEQTLPESQRNRFFSYG